MWGFNFLEMLGDGVDHKVANTEVDGFVVDTAAVTDSDQPFETAVADPHYNGGMWVIVELYDTRKAAEKGHARWVKAMKGKPTELRDVSTAWVAEEMDKLSGDSWRVYARQG